MSMNFYKILIHIDHLNFCFGYICWIWIKTERILIQNNVNSLYFMISHQHWINNASFLRFAKARSIKTLKPDLRILKETVINLPLPWWITFVSINILLVFILSSELSLTNSYFMYTIPSHISFLLTFVNSSNPVRLLCNPSYQFLIPVILCKPFITSKIIYLIYLRTSFN